MKSVRVIIRRKQVVWDIDIFRRFTHARRNRVLAYRLMSREVVDELQLDRVARMDLQCRSGDGAVRGIVGPVDWISQRARFDRVSFFISPINRERVESDG